MSETDGNASFLRAARAGNLEKVLDYLKGSTDINTSNANGLNALHLASKEGHVNVVTELLKRGANVGAATKKGNTALHIASLAGQEEIVKILVQHGASVNVQSQNGFTPLYMAAQENHADVVKFLLANGANQSLATEDGFTPLAVALQQGHDKVVTVLLENDSRGKVRLPALHIAAKKDDCKAAALLLQNDHNPDVTSKSGFTPLHIAAHYGNENIAVLLLERGADVNYAARHNITPLHVAAKWGKANMVTLLLDKGAQIDAKTRDGLTALHCAARSGHDNVVDLLLEKGAPIVAKTKNGLAPLHMASQGDHVDSARILLYHKAPVDDVTVDYLTALHVAAHCGHVRVAKLLLDRKADANSRALNGFTPLHIACKKNRIKVVELLLKHGASIEATTESGLTPLHVASFMGCMNIVIYLIQHGANPDVPTVRGETPLHLAARANQTDIIRILLRNGAHVDARAREQQTPLHIASRLGNTDIVVLLLQHGASVDAVTKDLYTPLHIAAKEGQEEVASILLEHGASLTATTQKGFTPLHLAAKYGNMKVARLLLQRDAPVDAQGKNGLTPLHVAAHYDHVNVALLLLDKGASPHAAAKNGYTPLHIAAKKNQMDIATTLLEYGAKPNAESKAGFTPLHLSSQEGHTDMASLLIEHHADVNAKAKNGLTPLHLCAQEDRVNVAAILVKNGAEIDPTTKAGYTPLHVACHFGQINMIRFLLQHNANVNAVTALGYTPLHQAAQQGHTLIINLLLQHKASPNAVTNQGQTALSIAQRLGYISVVETLKIVTETTVTTTTTTITEEKYKVVSPETMQEVFISDSEDEGAGEETMLGDMSFRYLSTDDRDMHDDSADMQDSRDMSFGEGKLLHDSLEGKDFFGKSAKEDHIEASVHQPYIAYQTTVHLGAVNPKPQEYVGTFTGNYIPDNVDISRQPVYAGFLVSFMVDARGGAMRGCRHSGVRVIIPPRKAPMPMRITCRYLKKEKLLHPPPLMEGEALASRVLEMGPSGGKFLGPVIIEIPHFASLRGKEREIMILRSDNGESWREHTLEASEEAVQEVLNESFDGDVFHGKKELSAIEDLNTTRITRILTTDFPQYFAIVTRIRQEVHAIGPEGGMVSSTVVPQVQAVFPEGALTKKIKVGLQAQPIPSELVAKMLGNRVAVSPIVTVEPRRRKFHKPITLTIPVPQAASKGMINQYSGEAPTLRLLCSITGGTTPAQWEDITGTTPLTFVNDCVSFTTTVSARFWLMDCRQVNEAAKFATDLYREAIMVPFMAKFVVFAKRHDTHEAKLRAFCMTDDKEDKTLESQEHFIEVAKSRDVEVLDSKPQFVEFAGNLIPVTKSGEQLHLNFHPFQENRLPFIVRVKDPHQDAIGRIAFMREPKVGRGEPPQSPLCNLTIKLPDDIQGEQPISEPDLVTLEKRYAYIKEIGIGKPETITKADLRLSDIADQLENDWVILALQLDITESEINKIKSDHPGNNSQQALAMLRLWLQRAGPKATGNNLEKSLRKINREDIVKKCMFNVELVTDDMDRAIEKVAMDQSGFEAFKEELGPSRDASLRRDTSLDVSYDEGDMTKEGEISSSDYVFEFKEQPTVEEESLIKEKILASRTEEIEYEKTSKTIEETVVRTITKEIDYETLPEEKLEEEKEKITKVLKEKLPKDEPFKIVADVDEIVKEIIPSPESEKIELIEKTETIKSIKQPLEQIEKTVKKGVDKSEEIIYKVSEIIPKKVEKVMESKIEPVVESVIDEQKEIVKEDVIIPEVRHTEIITPTTVTKAKSPEEQLKKFEIMRQIGAEIAELESAYEHFQQPLISPKAEEKIEEEIAAVEEPVIVPALAKTKELVTEEIIVTRTPGLEEDGIQEKHVPLKTKTPPPTPVDKEIKDGDLDVTTPLVITQRSETTEIDSDGTVRKTITTITTETTAKSFMQDEEIFPEALKSQVAAKLAESETFHSEDLDVSTGDEPCFVEEKEWTETGETGFVKRVVKKVSYSTPSGHAGSGASQVLEQELIKDKDKAAALSSVEELDQNKQMDVTSILPDGEYSEEIGEIEKDFEFVEIPELQLKDHFEIEKKITTKEDQSDDEKEKDEGESEFLLVSSVPDKHEFQPPDESPDGSGGPTGLSVGIRKGLYEFSGSVNQQFERKSADVKSNIEEQSQELDSDVIESDSDLKSVGVAERILFFEKKTLGIEISDNENELELEKETAEEHFHKGTAEVSESEEKVILEKVFIHESIQSNKIEPICLEEYMEDHAKLMEERLEEIFQKVEKEDSHDETKASRILPHAEDFKLPVKEDISSIKIEEEEKIINDLEDKQKAHSFEEKDTLFEIKDYFKSNKFSLIEDATSVFKFEEDRDIAKEKVKVDLKFKKERSDFEQEETSLLMKSCFEYDQDLLIQDIERSSGDHMLKQTDESNLNVIKDYDKESEDEKEKLEDSEKSSLAMKQAIMAVRFVTKDSDKDSSLLKLGENDYLKESEIKSEIDEMFLQECIDREDVLLKKKISKSDLDYEEQCRSKSTILEEHIYNKDEKTLFDSKSTVFTPHSVSYEEKESENEEEKEVTVEKEIYEVWEENINIGVISSGVSKSAGINEENQFYDKDNDKDIEVKRINDTTLFMFKDHKKYLQTEEKEVAIEKEYIEETKDSDIPVKELSEIEIKLSQDASLELDDQLSEEISHVTIKQVALATIFLEKESLQENQLNIMDNDLIDSQKKEEVKEYTTSDPLSILQEEEFGTLVTSQEIEAEILSTDLTVKKQVILLPDFKDVFSREIDDIKKTEKDDSEDTMSEEDMVEVAGLKKEISMKPAALAAMFIASEKRFSNVYNIVTEKETDSELGYTSTAALPHPSKSISPTLKTEKELESDDEKEIDETVIIPFAKIPQEEKDSYLKQKLHLEKSKDKFGLTEHLKELEKTVHYATSLSSTIFPRQITSELAEIKLMNEETEKYKMKRTEEIITAPISDLSDSMKCVLKESEIDSHIEEVVSEKLEKIIYTTGELFSEFKDEKEIDLKVITEAEKWKVDEDQSPEKFVHETIESVHKLKCQEEQWIARSETETISTLDIEPPRSGDEVLDEYHEEKFIDVTEEKSESEVDDGTEKYEIESPEDIKPIRKQSDAPPSDKTSEQYPENEICVVASELVAKVLEKTIHQLSEEQEQKIISTKEKSNAIFATMTDLNTKQNTVLRTVSPTPYEIVPEISSEKSEIVLTTTDSMQLPTALVTSQPPFLLEQPLVAEHVIVPPQTEEEAVMSQTFTESLSRVDQVLKTPIDVEERFPLPSSKETFHDIILEKHPPITKISPEEESSSEEEEISPVEEYPPTLGADMKIPVGVSPTEEKTLSELPDLSQVSETIVISDISEIESKVISVEQETAQAYDSFMCYDNGAFVGEEQIDLEESLLERDEESDCIQHELEVMRENDQWENEKNIKESTESIHLDYCEESIVKQIKSEIFSEEMEQSIGTPSPEGKQIFKDSPEETVAKHIRSEIFATEMEQSIDTPSPEQKDIFEEGEEETVARHIRSEIFAEEFNQSIETPSPECKEISRSLSAESNEKDESDLSELQREVVEKTVQHIIQTSAEICAEEASKSMKKDIVDLRSLELDEKSVKIAEEHTPEQILWEVSVQDHLESREAAADLVLSKSTLSAKEVLQDKIYDADDSKMSLDHLTLATVSSDIVAINDDKITKNEISAIKKHEISSVMLDDFQICDQQSEREEARKFSSESSEISGEDLEEKIDFHLTQEYILDEKSYLSETIKDNTIIQEDNFFDIHKKHSVEIFSEKKIKTEENIKFESDEHYKDLETEKSFETSESLINDYEKQMDVSQDLKKKISENYDSSDSYKSYGDSAEHKFTLDSHFYAFDTNSSQASQETAEGYTTCVTSQEGSEKTSGDMSYCTAATSQESCKIGIISSQEDSYHTAHSSWSGSGISDSSYDESAASSVASSYQSKYETSESETMLASDTETEERASTPIVCDDTHFDEKKICYFPETEASGYKATGFDTLEYEFSHKYFDKSLEWGEVSKAECMYNDDDDDTHPTSPFEMIDPAEVALYEDYAEPIAIAAATLVGSVMETSQASTAESFENLQAESEYISSQPYSHVNGPVEVDYYPEIPPVSDTQRGSTITTIDTAILEQSPDEPAISRTESGEYLSNELLDEYAEYSVSSESRPSSGGRLLSEGSDEMARSFEQTQLLEIINQECQSINPSVQVNGPVEVEYIPETSPHFPSDTEESKLLKQTTDSEGSQSKTYKAQEFPEFSSTECNIPEKEIEDDENTVYIGERYSDLEDMGDIQEDINIQQLEIVDPMMTTLSDIEVVHKEDENLSDSSSEEQEIQNIQEIQEIQEMQEYQELQQQQYYYSDEKSEMHQYSMQRAYEESTIETKEVIGCDIEAEISSLITDLKTRPISQAESLERESEIQDSDDQRVWTELQFSDDHPDLEFKTLDLQPSDILSEKEIEEYERPPSPEPSEEYEIKQAQGSKILLTEIEMHHDSHFAVSEYESTITEESAIKEEKSEKKSFSMIHSFIKETEHNSFHVPEDKMKMSSDQEKLSSLLSVDIPDITVTQHMSREVDSKESLCSDTGLEMPVTDNAKQSDNKINEIESFEVIEKIDDESLKDLANEDNFEFILESDNLHKDIIEDITVLTLQDEHVTEISTDKLDEEERAALKELQEQIIQESNIAEQQKQSVTLTESNFEFITKQQYIGTEEIQEQEYEKAEKEYGQFSDYESKNTPEFDSVNKRFFSKSGESDDVSVSSLQEFEGLEMEIRHQEMLSKNNGSDADSLNGKKLWSRSGDHDDISMSSLQEFEKLEQELTEEEKIESSKPFILEYKSLHSFKEQTVLESEKQEKSSQDSDVNEYEKRMSEIDEIIRQAESNLESFEAELQQRDHHQLCEIKSTDTCSSHATESSVIEHSIVGDIDGEEKYSISADINEAEHITVARTVSGQSSASQLSRESHGHSPTSLTPQCDSDSLKDRELDFDGQDFDSKERCFDADSLQEKMMDEEKDREFDRDSLQAAEEIDQEFEDSLQEKKIDSQDYDRDSLMGSSATSAQLFEDDSTLEPSSSCATHATYHDNDSLQASITSSLPLSSDDNAGMISSIDSLNAEQTTTTYISEFSSGIKIPYQSFDPEIHTALVEHDVNEQFIDKEGNIHVGSWYKKVTKSYVDPEGNIRTVTTYIKNDGTSHIDYHESTSDIDEELINSHAQIKLATEIDSQPAKVVSFDVSSYPAEITDYISEKRPSEEVVTITRKIHHIVNPGTISKEELSKILQQSEPEISKEEITDKIGNVTRTVVCKTSSVSEPIMHSFSGPEIDHQMAEFIKKSKEMEWEHENKELDRCAELVMKKQVEFLTEFSEKDLPETTHEVVETSETTDEKGNVIHIVTRKVTHFNETQLYQTVPHDETDLSEITHTKETIFTVPSTDDHTAPFAIKKSAPWEGGPKGYDPTSSSEFFSHSEDHYSGPEAVSTNLSTQPSLDWSDPSHHASGQEYKGDTSRVSIDEEGEVEVDITEHDDLRGQGWKHSVLQHRTASIDDDGKAEHDVTEHDWQFAHHRSGGLLVRTYKPEGEIDSEEDEVTDHLMFGKETVVTDTDSTEQSEFLEPYERHVHIVRDESSGAPSVTSGTVGVTTRTVTRTVIRDGEEVTTVTEETTGDENLQQSMQEIIDQFMADPQTQQYYQQYSYEDQDE